MMMSSTIDSALREAPSRRYDKPTAFLPLVASGTGAPFFLLHPATPLPWCYTPLAEHATWDRPIYAARSIELDWQHDLLGMDDLVLQYLIDLRHVQPKGPYCLGGWSLGGILAFEIACRLAQDGQPVSRLIMFDTHAPADALQRGRRRLQLLALDLLRPLVHSAIGRRVLDRIGWINPLGRALLRLRFDRPLTTDAMREIVDAAFPELSGSDALAGASFEQLCDWLVDRLRPIIPEVFLKEFERAYPNGRSTDFVRYYHLRWKNHWLGFRHKATRVFPGQITVYAATDNHRVAGWQAFSRQPLEVRRLPIKRHDGLDTHLSFFHSENVKLFADDLSQLIRAS